MEAANTANVLYQGWEMDGVTEAGDVANYAQFPSSPGFTAINQRPMPLIPPSQSSVISPTQQYQTKVRTIGEPSRHRNPTVASYLGLGDSAEPAHLVKYAPTPDGQPPPQPTRKRRVSRKGERTSARKKANTDSKKASTQTRVLENLPLTKNLNQPIAHKCDTSIEEPLPTPASTVVEAVVSAVRHSQTDPEEQNFQIPDTNRSRPSPAEATHIQAAVLEEDDDEFGQLCFDFESRSHPPVESAHQELASPPIQHEELYFNEDDFDDDLMDDDLLGLPIDTVDEPSSLSFQSSSPLKLHSTEDLCQETQTPDTPANAASVLDEEINSSSSTLKKFVSPVTLSTRLLAATGDEAHKPIIRPPFPVAVRDRSPIIGMSSNTLLRTCFRVGEAINQSCQAVKAGNNILIELYARVLNSERDDLQQRFTLCDLFHAKPPHIQATYAAAIWKTVQLFEYDSARLLQQGRICRCMGTMKRDGKGWVMTILNIWEATWDDVQWVEGIVKS